MFVTSCNHAVWSSVLDVNWSSVCPGMQGNWAK